MPSSKFWPANEQIVSTPNRNYTVNDYKQLFDDLNFTIGYEYRLNTENLTSDMRAPGVETHCLYGVGVKTPERFFFKRQSDFPDKQPSVVYGDGDGTVNLISMLGFRQWRNDSSNKIYFKEIPGAEHLEILGNKKVLNYISELFLI
jgi:lysophospholipase-3